MISDTKQYQKSVYRRLLLPLFLGLTVALTVGACVVTSDSSLTVDNQSDYTIVEINLAPVDSTTWGPDLLGSGNLYPGESITIDFIDCDTYDLRIIDDTYAECVIYDVDLCFDNDVWVITNYFLDDCVY